MNYHTRFLIVCFLVALGCSGAIPLPDARHINWARNEWPDADSASLANGRRVYISKCSGCHALYEPHRFNGGEWDSSLTVMSVKAKIHPDETMLIKRYIHAIISQPPR